MLQENCYVVSDDTKECVIIDCGAYYDEEGKAIVDYINSNGLHPVHLLVTHGHIDHNFGNHIVFKAFGLRPEVSGQDEDYIINLSEQAERIFHISFDIEPVSPIKIFKENETITFGNHKLKILETPGHSRGSVCFYEEDEHVLFTGDTLFRNSIGRTDLGGGSMMQIIQSLRFLAQLPDDTEVYPGHGAKTTIGFELEHNPYMER